MTKDTRAKRAGKTSSIFRSFNRDNRDKHQTVGATMTSRRRAQTPRELCNAIGNNNLRHVKFFIENGGDPNVDLTSFAPAEISAPAERCLRVDITALEDSLPEGVISPLHIAVCNCYTRESSDSALEIFLALEIVKNLIDAGADASVAVANFWLNRCTRWGCTTSRIEVRTAVTPCDLARLIQQKFSPRFTALFDGLIVLLGKAAPKDRCTYKTLASLTVPKSVTETWKALLFSEKFSDVKFKCQDGTTFHAHKNILAAASPYFSAAFEGPWGEQHQDGLWETSNSPAVMKAVLSFMYIGEVTPDVVEQQSVEMLAVASEYDLSELQNLCEASCARSLDNDNVKSVLQLAHLHGSRRTLQKSSPILLWRLLQPRMRSCGRSLPLPSLPTLLKETNPRFRQISDADRRETLSRESR
jgi:hypothetical protein